VFWLPNFDRRRNKSSLGDIIRFLCSEAASAHENHARSDTQFDQDMSTLCLDTRPGAAGSISNMIKLCEIEIDHIERQTPTNMNDHKIASHVLGNMRSSILILMRRSTGHPTRVSAIGSSGLALMRRPHSTPELDSRGIQAFCSRDSKVEHLVRLPFECDGSGRYRLRFRLDLTRGGYFVDYPSSSSTPLSRIIERKHQEAAAAAAGCASVSRARDGEYARRFLSSNNPVNRRLNCMPGVNAIWT
jgi:hypothetical protein